MLPVAGTLIDDRYEIRRTIGCGGMGVVYEAYQHGLERNVALKLLTASCNQDALDLARFEREALTLSKLRHPNVVQFYAYGIWQNMPYIAMELLHGHSLQENLSRNEPMQPNEALRILIEVCEALNYAHAKGIFHRDIKPSNVILADGGGTAKLIDFGLARLVSTAPMQKLTQTGMAIGSVLYMSPEQCAGRPADARSDIYSLGCVMHHCLTGVPPFSGDTRGSRLRCNTVEALLWQRFAFWSIAPLRPGNSTTHNTPRLARPLG